MVTMQKKLDEIIRKIEDTKAFSDTSYLRTTHFVIFLVFGSSEEQLDALSRKSRDIIAERGACAFLPVTDSEGVVNAVWEIIEDAAKNQLAVDDLTSIHLCPVIFSSAADSSIFLSTIKSVEQSLRRSDKYVEIKPFLLLDASNRNSENSAKWLDVLGRSIRSQEFAICRCCVLSNMDAKDISVAEERLVNTIFFIAFLNVVRETRDDIGHIISYKADRPEELFYTAQTAFVCNPVVMRILNRMRLLLERLGGGADGSSPINMDFMQEILRSIFEKLPQEDGQISLLPLYGVMPSPGGDEKDLSRRLRDFVNKYYLSFSRTDENEAALLRQIREEFLRAVINSGTTVSDLQSLIGNKGAIDNLSKIQVADIHIAELPEYPGRVKQSVSDAYRGCAEGLRKALLRVGKDLLDKFFASYEFQTLPKAYLDARERIKLADEALLHRYRLQDMIEVKLELFNDPDERWINEYNDRAVRNAYMKLFAALALSENEEDENEIMAQLLENLYAAAKGLTGGGGAQDYMRLVSGTCEDPDSESSKKCISVIKGELTFPLRVSGVSGQSDSHTYVWGNRENNLNKALERQHDLIRGQRTFLSLNANERFVILQVSEAFDRDSILGFARGTSAAEDAAETPENAAEMTEDAAWAPQRNAETSADDVAAEEDAADTPPAAFEVFAAPEVFEAPEDPPSDAPENFELEEWEV
jgi:hypothetical protein